MTIATGHSMTSSSAITVRPAYQATCSAPCESAADTRERGLALRRFTPRTPRTRPFVGDADRTVRGVRVVDSLRLVMATGRPERDLRSGATTRRTLYSSKP